MKTLKPPAGHSQSFTLLDVGFILYLGVIAICLNWLFDINPFSMAGQTLLFIVILGTIFIGAAVDSWRRAWVLSVIGGSLIGAATLIAWLFTIGGVPAVAGLLVLTLLGAVVRRNSGLGNRPFGWSVGVMLGGNRPSGCDPSWD